MCFGCNSIGARLRPQTAGVKAADEGGATVAAPVFVKLRPIASLYDLALKTKVVARPKIYPMHSIKIKFKSIKTHFSINFRWAMK